MLPIATKTGDPVKGWEAGLTWVFVQSFVLMAGGFIAPVIRKITPRAALLGTLAGVSIAFISMRPAQDMFSTPLIGITCFAIILVSWFGGVRGSQPALRSCSAADRSDRCPTCCDNSRNGSGYLPRRKPQKNAAVRFISLAGGHRSLGSSKECLGRCTCECDTGFCAASASGSMRHLIGTNRVKWCGAYEIPGGGQIFRL
jgi:hypothetical protein